MIWQVYSDVATIVAPIVTVLTIIALGYHLLLQWRKP